MPSIYVLQNKEKVAIIETQRIPAYNNYYF